MIPGHPNIHTVQEKLLTQSVILTVFSKYGSEEIKDRDHGMNFDGSIFSSKSSPKSSPNKLESTFGDMPKRKLSFLAKSSRGAIFQLDSLVSGDRSRNQQVEERAAETIMQQVKREESMCKSCVCKETDLQQLISACRVTACA